jgi:LysM repeat protein
MISVCSARPAAAVSVFLLALLPARAQYNGETIRAYVEEWWPVAVSEMQEYGIPASISLAQGILESAAGTSELARQSNNHFGIKCHKEWTGKKVYYDDDAKGECFRKYPRAEDSWADHSEFLRTRDRYASLFELQPDDYRGWAHGLKKAGYATNPRYAELLIKLIHDYELHSYDKRQGALAGRGRRRPVPPSAPVAAVSGVFYFNRIPTVLARAGEYPRDISVRQDVPLGRLCDYNDFTPSYALSEGEKVYLKPKRRRASARMHTVRSGESLRDIAQEYGVLLELLARRNQVGVDFIPAAGERIELRGKAEHPPKAAPAREQAPGLSPTPPGLNPPARDAATVRDTPSAQQSPAPAGLALPAASFHEVATGDTLFNIARRYNISVDDLRSWNQLPDNTIKIGQKLVVGR